MTNLTYVLACVLALGPWSSARADVRDGEPTVPRFTVVGRETPALRARLDRLGEALDRHVAYWRARGLHVRTRLDGAYVFDDAGTLTLADVFAALNRAGPDVAADLRKQRGTIERSPLFVALDRRGPDAFAPWDSREALITELLDQYCGFTYGFMVRDTEGALASGRPLAQLTAHPSLPLRENALFQRTYPVDVRRLLPASPTEPLVRIEDVRDMARAAHDDQTLREFLVVTPRYTQRADDRDLDALATVSDASVPRHELGHWVRSQLTRDGEHLPMPLEEAFADYTAAAPLGDPVIGASYARASGEVAARMRRPFVREGNVEYVLDMDEYRDRGRLRDLARPASVESVARHLAAGDPYDDGDPARAFLWRVRESLSPTDRLRFDELTLVVVGDLGHLPMVIADRSQRRVDRRVRRAARLRRVLEAALRFAFTTFDRTRAPERRAAAEAVLDEAPELLAGVTAGADAARARRVRRETVRDLMGALTLPDGFNWYLARAAFVRAGVAAVDAHLARAFAGLRPPVATDYLLPELLRAYLRAAEARAPDLVPRVRAEAARVMNAAAVRFDLGDDGIAYAFVRGRSALHARVAVPALRARLGELARLRTRIAADRASGLPLEDTLARYGDVLDRTHEFERTGAVPRLFAPVRACARWLTRGGS